MNITEVRIKIVNKEGSRVKALASLTIDECFVIHDIKVIEKEDKFVINMPNKKNTNGKYFDIAHPINVETREQVNNAVLNAYKKAKENETVAE